MLPRFLEPEVMDTADEARDYDAMDHSAVNRAFAADFFALYRSDGPVLDVGTGTAQIPIELCRRSATLSVIAIDLAEHMLRIAERNVAAAGLTGRVRLERVNARGLPYPDGHFPAVVSNSIIHHIPNPTDCFAEVARVCGPGGVLFVRDLLRPDSGDELRRIVDTYAAGANDHQRTLFAASLHAALTLDEVRAAVGRLGFAPELVRQTSDRHWTFAVARR
jgi:ubiquinone/menaquinone biosynthesis C-methylase UbiE